MRYRLIDIDFNPDDYDIIIDARAPLEYAEDHIHGAINLPVLDDEQRCRVGTLYKESAFQAARLGGALVAENISKHLLGALADVPQKTTLLVYCWRGNQRSRSFAHVLQQVGWHVRVIEGGYKNYRSGIIKKMNDFFENPSLQLKIIAGFTGSGKTHLLKKIRENGSQVIDLEKLANHMGSVFGSPNLGSQPSQKAFENELLRELEQLDLNRPIFVESESSRVGNVFCPPGLWKQMKLAEVIEIELSMPDRIDIIRQDYHYFLTTKSTVIDLINRLKELRGKKQVALWIEQVESGNWSEFIESLLKNHYDLSYKPAGTEGSPFQTPTQRIEIENSSPEAFLAAAQQIAAWYH